MIDDKGHRLVANVLRKVGNLFYDEDTIIEEARFVLKAIGTAPDAPHICGHRYESMSYNIFEGCDRQGIRVADYDGKMILRGINSDFAIISYARCAASEWMSIERREL